jgi:NitT/TauT family transport system substrate-binding protein
MKHRPIAAAAVTAAALLLAACAGSPAPSTTGDGKPISTTPITIGVSSDPTSLSLVVADKKGFFAKRGITATTRLFTSAGDALTAAVSGSVQLAGPVSDLTLLGTRAKGADVQAVGILDSTGKQVGLVGTRDITSADDLKGKTVGMTAGVAAQFFQVRYFAHYGLTDSSTKVVNIAPPDTVAALAGHQVDAFFGFEPWLSKASSAVPGAHVVAYSGAEDIYPLKLALAGTTSWLGKNVEATKAVLDAAADGAKWIAAHKSDAIDLAVSTYHLDEATATTLVQNQDFTVLSPSQLTSIYTDGATFLNDQKVVSIPDPAGFVAEVINTKPFGK